MLRREGFATESTSALKAQYTLPSIANSMVQKCLPAIYYFIILPSFI